MKEIISCNKIVDSNGNTVHVIDPYFKVVYFYIRSKYEHYLAKERDYFESAKDIGKAVAISPTKVKRIVKLMRCLGIIEDITERARANTLKVNCVTTLQNLTLLEVEDEIKLSPVEVKQDITRPCNVYLQELTSPAITSLKFGVANDTPARMKQQSDESFFSHSLIQEWTYPTRDEALSVEKAIKAEFGGYHLKKKWMPDGYTETLPYSIKDEVISFISSLK